MIHVDVTIPVCKTLPYLDDLFNSIYNLDTAGLHVHWYFVVDHATPEQVAVESQAVAGHIQRLLTWRRYDSLWDAAACVCDTNQGLGEARNIGVRQGTSPYVMWMDSDDLFTPESLVGRVSYMEAHPDVQLAYGTYYTFRGDFTQSVGAWGDPGIKHFSYAALFKENQFHPASVIMRRDVWEPFGRERVAEDYVYFLQRCRVLKTAYIEGLRVLYYRLRDDSLSTGSESQKAHYGNVVKTKRAIWKSMTPEERAGIQGGQNGTSCV